MSIELTQSDIIGIIGAMSTVVVGVLSWFISAFQVKKTLKRQELQYRMKITPLVNNKLFKEADKLEIKYKDDIIDELVFLEVDIINSGNIAIQNPPIKIESNEVYVIPAYLEDIPNGYDLHWEIEREDGETCKINADHINPGQILKARFLMDKMPKEEPMFICAMPNLQIKRISTSDIEDISLVTSKLLEVLYPSLANVIKLSKVY